MGEAHSARGKDRRCTHTGDRRQDTSEMGINHLTSEINLNGQYLQINFLA
jgi:hypothetical protein